MLKPNKKLTKKEIQHDPLLEFLNNVQLNLKGNKNRYLQIFGGAVLAIVLIFALTDRMQDSALETESNLGLALASLESGDMVNGQFQLENIVNSSSGSSKSVAQFYLAKIKYNAGFTGEAIQLLENFLDGSEQAILTPKGYLLLANIYAEEKQLDKALKMVKKGIRSSDSDSNTNNLLSFQADILFQQGKIQEASTINDALLTNKNLDMELRIKVEMLSGKLNG